MTLALFETDQAPGAPGIACESRINRVVVYARGAVVTRRVTLPEELPAAVVDLEVGGITALAESGSIRALVDGDRELVGLHSRIVLPPAPVAPGEARERVLALHDELERLKAERVSLSKRRAALAAVQLDPGMGRRWRPADPAARMQDALALSALLGETLGELDGALRRLDRALDQTLEAIDAAELAAAQGSSAAVKGAGRPSLAVAVRLAAGSGALRGLELEYVVRAARFWPAYAAHFSAGATRVRWTLDAFVAQASGEDWERVKVALSTADLAHDARLPELRALRLGRAQPPVRKGYRPAPAGLDALFGAYDQAVARAALRPPAAAVTRSLRAAGPTASAEATRTRAAEDGAAGDALDLVSDDDEPVTAGGYGAPPGMARLPAPAPAFGGAGQLGAPPQGASAGVPMSMSRSRSAPTATGHAGPPPAAAPMAMPASGALRRKSRGGGGSAGELSEEGSLTDDRSPAPPAAIEPADAWLDFDALVLAPASDRARRGRLVLAPRTAPSAQQAVDRIEAIASPATPSAFDPRATRGQFDHRHDARGLVDVPDDARPHRIAIDAAEAPSRPRFVAVPREAAEVYREAEIKNPFAAPLLAGPVDVFVEGALMATSQVSFVDRGGTLRLGLGVEDRLRVARNARVEESSAGLLGGTTAVEHAISIDLASSLGHAVEVDLFDRVPVSDEKDLDVKLSYSRPEAEKYDQAERGAPVRGGLRWRIAVPAGGKARVELGYRLTLPARNEVLGGNRRD